MPIRTSRLRWRLLIVASLVLVLGGLLLVTWARAGSSRTELQRTKRGFQYVVAALRLSLRDPARDAREDLANDAGLYRYGGLPDIVPGADDNVVRRMGTRGTASGGCFGDHGAFATFYYGIEEGYVTRYNEAKIRAFRASVHVEGGPDVERKVLDLIQRATDHPGQTVVKREAR